MEKQVVDLENKPLIPGFWNNQLEAKQIMLKISDLRHDIEEVKKLSKNLHDLIDLSEINADESDQILEKQISEETILITKAIEALELNSTLTGPYDTFDTIVSIQSGAGGVD